ncbi:NAD(P)H-dependent oxidoreductase [Nocardia seriolae]|nr:NAD(P)H-dependent oxidoreductase [Nocardia seriolae]APB01062.1 hypothetical protein NS506_07035 [Nocardia seriolae]MTJ65589.1 hypothetical protein [Nocardia seriolae]MTJ72764.1 hypothetical protein [Nocardia seriolae]MTJ90466.1 hypothetical protein [Nocardia seriolae]MTK34426.1 hypothetical protein [Nocardia seriolae]
MAPIHFCNCPPLLEGWINRVWTLDFAFGLTEAGRHGDVEHVYFYAAADPDRIKQFLEQANDLGPFDRPHPTEAPQ